MVKESYRKKDIKKTNNKTIIGLIILTFCISIFFSSSIFAKTENKIDIQNSYVQSGITNKWAAGLKGIYAKLKPSNNQTSFQNRKDKLIIVNAGFSAVKNSVALGFQDLQMMEDEENVEPKVIGDALCYPNPFRQATGTTLGYELSKDMDIDIYLYNMMAQLIAKKTYSKQTDGGHGGYNTLNLEANFLDGKMLSAGVYFYLIVHNDKVLAKGKMAVKP
ncbi:hypothetical protein DID75_00395 [Candidatus Marinamargulisbacteria bacterium SCGC AG-410-N11]|nr:hypothetical protein DID75_00395 [Candidatus Marinamargulisbacteria bacterium SCGC AG-410-N11]